MAEGKLAQKVALVTGASSGIGEATAIALASTGAKVALAARRTQRLKKLVKRISESGGQAMPIVTDVADETQVREMVNKAAGLGNIDILVNNAGVMLPAPIEQANTEDWRRMIDINVLGLMYVTQAVLPLMKKQGGGHIVNISSTAGRETRSGFAAYDVTKYGVVAFSDALRKEVHKDNIRVTCIEPGAVSTQLVDRITNVEAKAAAEQYLDIITMLEGEDIAAAVLYAVTQHPRVQVNEILIRPTMEV
ncbi:MAG: putative oxidoreductase [Chroococcidiopsis cubana SAG 39.79]|uniref:Oxidoreductase n=1 Tax=Chroococcidiopsis cubana SAG 39.79 TaxID=388085 RepID=A0AB37U7Q2_9CYAN|nr:SDR family NAD(P)-dependent oxidoreductase [Chroococcidiopsis cubana]MDZ4877129.1 putative oxidoreductase [Chroococcidiopsis cubana SAG 39.79]PSB57526.1 oxidoreductase [Chroococcidiopsis cubana CCALA 043]RUS95267.1 oxidoreductase [Chroococcidiopsis cubana SAG 39.79]